jgi:hypothetical protein
MFLPRITGGGTNIAEYNQAGYARALYLPENKICIAKAVDKEGDFFDIQYVKGTRVTAQVLSTDLQFTPLFKH